VLTIAGVRHYLLTIIDYFSRYVLAWGVVIKTVTHREVQDLLTLAYISEGIEQHEQKSILRTYQGTPNRAGRTRKLIKELEMILSPGRACRPTDNSCQERWYQTVKQEEIYCYPTYPSVERARSSLAHYIEYYNEKRPHQALLNYNPGQVITCKTKANCSTSKWYKLSKNKEERLTGLRLRKMIMADSN